ncbi:hypothetical protein ACWGB8_19360 [Kitasatospora sp. NPDC054939]
MLRTGDRPRGLAARPSARPGTPALSLAQLKAVVAAPAWRG